MKIDNSRNETIIEKAVSVPVSKQVSNLTRLVSKTCVV